MTGNSGFKDNTRKHTDQLTWAHRDSRRLNQQSGKMHGTELGPLHIYYKCVFYSSCEIPNNELGLSLAMFSAFETCLFYWIVLIEEKVPNFTAA